MNRSALTTSLAMMLRLSGAWVGGVLVITALVYTAIEVSLAIWAEASPIWASASWVLHWAALAGGFAIASCLPLLVSQGVTRRTARRAGTVALLIVSAAAAVAMQVGLVVEWAAFRLGGAGYELPGGHSFDAISQVHFVLAGYGLQFAGFAVSGWLAFACYQRVGGWWGTLSLPLILAPAAGTLALVSAGWPDDRADDPAWVGTLDPAIAIPLAAVPVLAGLVAIHALVRTVAVKSP